MMPKDAYRLFDAEQVAAAYDEIAQQLNDQLPAHEVMLLPVMTGGMFPACELARRIRRPMKIDYVHATRYRGKTRGSDIEWLHWPELPEEEETVLLIDDIFDEGHTLAAIRARLPERFRVISIALALKEHDRGLQRGWLDIHGLVVPDIYVFGCGMDYHENFRELPDIWALPSDV
ncbi:MAG TPA: phosphoribosyltransferase family protein [Wenzhouxiangellaceae bacterium]|nr:phosphoribosyltransferase family protein [Wenzhouxiangellaceae bacterium]